MNQPTCFDVLIVYAQSLAISAYDTNQNTPFASSSPNASYNLVYGYFLQICQKLGLTAAFTTSADIIGPGLCRSFWTYDHYHWQKSATSCFSPLIFDKFSPVNLGIKSRRQLLFSASQSVPFNDSALFNLFFDKQLTYNYLAAETIPTVSLVNSSLTTVNQSLASLDQLTSAHSTPADFGSDIIMKDRFGAGGRHVYKFKSGQAANMLTVTRLHPRISFILQPFIKFDRGFSYHQHPASTDIRLIYLKGKIAQSYIRVAKLGEFRCNEHQGGLLTYLNLKEIPANIIAKSNKIAAKLNQQYSLFALDFIISNSGHAYLLEGNTGPGLDWNIALKKNEICAKKLIRLVVAELFLRSKPSPVSDLSFPDITILPLVAPSLPTLL